MTSEEKLLTEIRERFQYCVDYWREIREAGDQDMKYLAGDPWDPEERARRKKDGRPCLAEDELNQYVNQLINDVRQTKHAIKVIPAGDGADDETAEFRADVIRQIEYKSKAQSAYTCAFENAASRGYGAFRISKRYVKDDAFEQELAIRRIPNPNTVYVEPDTKEADHSDMKYAFVLERMKYAEFRRRWPKATVTDFSREIAQEAPGWIGEKDVQVAEYWRVESSRYTLYQLGDGSKIGSDELPNGAKVGKGVLVLSDGSRAEVVNERRAERRKVVQYLTNGVEVLEENDWEDTEIPIIFVVGKEMYVPDGSGSKRVLMSLVRLARDPYMRLCYIRTVQAELAGQVPKVPWTGYEGQFEGHEDEWNNSHRVPIGFLQAKPIVDQATGQILPLPKRTEWTGAPILALEATAESAKRAIQSAMGMFNASVGKHDSNAQSGVALEKLALQSNQGSFHFIDNYDWALERAGRICNRMLKVVYDSPREIGTRKADDSFSVVKINEPYLDEKTKEEVHLRTDQGEHDVTISTGPNFQSQREEASSFADTLAGIPEVFGRIADLIVKLKNLGPIGDQIAERLKPPDAEEGAEIPPAAKQAMAQLQQQLQAINEYAKQLEAKLQEAQSGAQLKQMELESRERIAAMEAQVKLVIEQAKLESKEGIEMLRQEIAAINARLPVQSSDEAAVVGA